MTWDYLVVGSGITGLAFGAMMAKHQGKRVCVLEKHKVAGGYATEFYRKRGEHRFECSLHKVSGISDIGNLKRILANLGFEFELEYVYPPSFFKGYFNNRVMALSNQVDTQITQLCREFPEEKESIEKYFALVASYGKWGYYQFQIMKGEMDADFKLIRHGKKTFAKLTLADYLKEHFSNEYLKNILAAPAIYVGANPEQISFLYYLHVVFATLNAGNAFIKGGGQALSNFMVDIIKENGGEVHLANPVHELSFKGDRFITAHARLGNYSASHLIMNASPHYAVRELFPKTEMMIEVDKKLLALKPANSTTTLYLSLKRQPESLGFDDTESMLFATGMSQEIAFRNLARDSNRSSDFEVAYWAQGTMEVTNYLHLIPIMATLLWLTYWMCNVIGQIDKTCIGKKRTR